MKEAGTSSVASRGLHSFKVAGASISGWYLSAKTPGGRQPFTSQLDVRPRPVHRVPSTGRLLSTGRSQPHLPLHPQAEASAGDSLRDLLRPSWNRTTAGVPACGPRGVAQVWQRSGKRALTAWPSPVHSQTVLLPPCQSIAAGGLVGMGDLISSRVAFCGKSLNRIWSRGKRNWIKAPLADPA